MDNAQVPAQSLEAIQQTLANGEVSDAGEIIDQLLRDYPDDPNLGYLSALRYRLSDDSTRALTILDELIARFPTMARAHQEIAINSLACNLPEQALSAAEQAVFHDGSLVKCWELLEPLHRTFAPDKLGTTQQQIRFLRTLPTELRTVISYLSSERLNDAERLCKYF